MKKILLASLLIFLSAQIKAQNNSDTSSYLRFVCVQKIEVYLDSAKKYEVSTCWETVKFDMVLDPFGNRIKVYQDGKAKIITLGTKTARYKESDGDGIIHNWEFCTDGDGRRMAVRIKFPPTEKLDTNATYVYYDYKSVTYGFQLFFLKN